MKILQNNLILCVCLISFFYVSSVYSVSFFNIYKNRQTWSLLCLSSPHNSSINRLQDAQCALGKDRKSAAFEFKEAVLEVTKIMQNLLGIAEQWTDELSLTYDGRFEPYVQRLELHENDKVIFHGDMHGDIHSLIIELEELEAQGFLEPGTFRLLKDDVFLIFLGDYTDRGYYGVEVIYTLCRLKMANPDRVFMVRGNHEDVAIGERYGFGAELEYKLDLLDDDSKSFVYDLYNYLPVALYIGCGQNYLQCCHGGVEHGYNPGKLFGQEKQYDLLGDLTRGDALQYKSIQDNMPTHLSGFYNDNFTPYRCCFKGKSIGFMWHDFTKDDEAFISFRGLASNETLTKSILDYQNSSIQNHGSLVHIHGIFRAHQHVNVVSDDTLNLMSELVESNGVYKMWRPIESGEKRSLVDGLVWTFNVSPDTCYGQGVNFGFGVYAILQVQKSYVDWTLRVYNTPVISGREHMGLSSR